MTVTMTDFEHQVTWQEFSRVAERPNRAGEVAFIRTPTHIEYDSDGTRGNYAVSAERSADKSGVGSTR